ncbi:MAG: multicomponent Na+:H+ antiporter subunit G [Gammaproteobacteria bacterium]|jgi:multicomponent Na+:H+ antiporter subunit G
MGLLLDILSWALLLAGGFFVVVGSLGLVRMPDFFTRVHAASITDTLGAGLIVAGLLLQSPHWLGSVKLMLIMVFLVLTGPAATHALAKAALHAGLRPHNDNDNGDDGQGNGQSNGNVAAGDSVPREDKSSNF